MATATTGFDSPTVKQGIVTVTVPASTVFFVGVMVGFNTSTNAVVRATDAANVKAIGRSEADAVAGDLLPVHCGFGLYKNSSSAALAAADFGDVCYIEDDTTVAKTSTNSARAGIFKGLRVIDGVTFALVDHTNNF